MKILSTRLCPMYGGSRSYDSNTSLSERKSYAGHSRALRSSRKTFQATANLESNRPRPKEDCCGHGLRRMHVKETQVRWLEYRMSEPFKPMPLLRSGRKKYYISSILHIRGSNMVLDRRNSPGDDYVTGLEEQLAAWEA